MELDVAVVGGGVSGLATAYALQRRGHRVAVLERQVRPGGNAVSERLGGFLMEHGPSTVASSSLAAQELSRALDLDHGRCELGQGVRQRYLVAEGRLRGIPVHPLGFLLSDYLSLKARLRLLAEALIPAGGAGAPGDEESVARFCARRFGPEFAERVIDPLVGGLYAGRAEELSISAVFPALVEFERAHGSVTLGLLRRQRRGNGMPGGRLFSWRSGIGALPRALAAALGPALRTGVAVRRLEPRPGGVRIDAGAAGTFGARAVVVATQPHVTAELLAQVDARAAAAAAAIEAPPLAVAFLGYSKAQVEHPLDGLGFLAPQRERRRLNGAQFCSTMFPGRAPEGFVAVAGYIGGARAPELACLPAPELIEIAQGEFRELIGARGAPLVARVRHWPRGLPQYRLGHQALLAPLVELGQAVPGIFVTGNYLKGPSVATCLQLAGETAAAVEGFLKWGQTPFNWRRPGVRSAAGGGN